MFKLLDELEKVETRLAKAKEKRDMVMVNLWRRVRKRLNRQIEKLKKGT